MRTGRTRIWRLRTLAQRLAQRPPRSDAPVVIAADGRCFVKLASTQDHDAWMIWWPPGGQLDLHDHGGSWGAVRVVAGELEEHVAGSGATIVRRLSAGDTVSFGSRHVHAVVNPGTATAVSVHVYSPPLRSMSFYRSDDHGALVARQVAIAADWGHS